MRIRRLLGLALATATLAGVSAVGAATARAATTYPAISAEECTAQGGTVNQGGPYRGPTCTFPDGHSESIT
ncbi:hypothetical protein [Streptomyces sp. NPDC048473]|uniref:hypothetical protein n=1 Tax=unclassified Streptomyces TaxID=2593676 RepID=UPI003711A7A7